MLADDNWFQFPTIDDMDWYFRRNKIDQNKLHYSGITVPAGARFRPEGVVFSVRNEHWYFTDQADRDAFESAFSS